MTNTNLLHYLMQSKHIRHIESNTDRFIVAVVVTDVVQRPTLEELIADIPNDFHIIGNKLIIKKR